MDFSKIIVRSWKILKKYRYLLWIGIFAGLTETGFFIKSPNFYTYTNHQPAKDLSISWQQIFNNWHHFWQLAWPYLVVLIGTAILLAVIIIYLGNASRAALILNVNSIEEGNYHKKSFKDNFNRGVPFIWRLFCIDFLACLLVFATIIVVLLPIFITGFLQANPALLILSGLIAIIGIVIVLILTVYLAITIKFASRIVVFDDTDTLDAFKKARQIIHLQAHNSLIAMLLNIGFNIAMAIAMAVGICIVGLILYGLGYALFLIVNYWVVMIYGIVAILALLFAIAILSGAFTVFLSSYWTLTYRAVKYLAHKRRSDES